MSDEKAISLLEQAEMVLEALLSFLPALEADEPCPSPDNLGQCAEGKLDAEQALGVVKHLVLCSRCRAQFRRWRSLVSAEAGTGTVSLDDLRKLMETAPDRASHALALVSKWIAGLLLPQAPEPGEPTTIETPVVGARGEPIGEWVSLLSARGPRIDSRYHLVLDLKSPEPVEGELLLQVALKDAQRRIELGVVTLAKDEGQLAVDLSDMGVKPGHLPQGNLEIVAVCPEPGLQDTESRLVETSDQLKLTLPGDRTRSGTVEEGWETRGLSDSADGGREAEPDDDGGRKRKKRREPSDE